MGIDSNSHFTCQSNRFNGITVISGLLAGAECGISAVVSHCVQCDLPPPSMFNRYIYYALLRTAIAQINVKLYLRCAQCMFKLDSQLYLRVCTLTTHIARLRACCCTSATTMDQWSIWWSPSTTSHAHSLLNIHLELQLRFESLQKESH